MTDVRLTRTERQLLLYDILYYCQICEWKEITNLLPVGKRMIQRDIADLTDAGLISVTYSKKEKGYIEHGSPRLCDIVVGKRRSHLLCLNRLGRLMRELESDDLPFEEKCDYEAIYGETPICTTAKDCYREMFPGCSERTMQRDFETLRNIGYYVGYNNEGHYYELDFPQELRADFGVYRKEGRLYRKG